MRKSISLNYVHIIFATKYRQPVLESSWRGELFEMIGRVSRSYECEPLAVGGYDDHIHILANLSRTLAAAMYIGQVKAASSQWITSHKTKPNVFSLAEGVCFVFGESFDSAQCGSLHSESGSSSRGTHIHRRTR